MKKLLAGVTALVTVGATGCFGVGTASADDTPIGGPPTPGAPGDQTALRPRRRSRSGHSL